MAIGLDLTNTEYGVAFPNAYGRIVTASVSRQNKGAENKHMVMIDLCVYASVEAADMDYAREVVFDRLYVPYTVVAGADMLSECYKWVITQEKYLEATAV